MRSGFTTTHPANEDRLPDPDHARRTRHKFAARGPKRKSPAAPIDAGQEVVQLPAFAIEAEKDTSYVGKSALSSTRIAVDIAELPQSVKVLNSSFLKAVNPFMLTDILNYTGGAQNGQLNWTSGRLNIRGFTGEGDYNDSFAPPSASTVDSSIYERFEVIKGPSTVFLAADGTPGGVVNKITKSTVSTPSTTLQLQVGLFDANHVDLDSTGRLTKDGKLLYRVVAAMQYSDGYYDHTYMHRFTVMPMFSYQFNPDTKIEIKAMLVETNFPSYNGLPIDPRTHQIFDVPATRSQSEDAPANWRHDAVNRVWMNFTSRLNEYVALRIAAMNAYDRADRLESLAATWNEARAPGSARSLPTTVPASSHAPRPPTTRSIATATSKPTLISISRPAPPPTVCSWAANSATARSAPSPTPAPRPAGIRSIRRRRS